MKENFNNQGPFLFPEDLILHQYVQFNTKKYELIIYQYLSVQCTVS
jgi:hypothetical protein